ncbi:hypothetical protein HID58_034508, partial [Brassica napus]
IRSYAQKKLFPSSENMTLAHVPPPRPKPNTDEVNCVQSKLNPINILMLHHVFVSFPAQINNVSGYT